MLLRLILRSCIEKPRNSLGGLPVSIGKSVQRCKGNLHDSHFSLRTCLVPIALSGDLFSTIPAIELSNFAVNERYRTRERAIRKVGAYALAAFIRPIAQYVSEFVGAKWLCIYALPNDKLIGYYGKLGFSRLSAEQESFVYSHVKPKYDDGCIVMYQPL